MGGGRELRRCCGSSLPPTPSRGWDDERSTPRRNCPVSDPGERFNFRGVGFSEGTWGNGVGQTDDAAAAVRAAGIAFPDLRLGIAGWSFGATTSLHWQIETGSTLPWVGVAPGIGSCHGSEVPEVSRLESADRLIIIGDRDQFATVDSIQAFAIEANARLEVLPNSDHFFYFREETVGSLVAEHLEVS